VAKVSIGPTELMKSLRYRFSTVPKIIVELPISLGGIVHPPVLDGSVQLA
jgi:hypothetical protein